MEHGHHGEGPSVEVTAMIKQMKALTDMFTAQANRQEELHQALLRPAQVENKSNFIQTQLMADCARLKEQQEAQYQQLQEQQQRALAEQTMSIQNMQNQHLQHQQLEEQRI
eukprot:9143510-Pyramimonas_sp.AAC.1